MSAMSNYLENTLIDFIFRGQPFTPSSNMYVGLFTSTPSDIGGGTEVISGSYTRATIISSLLNWAGTQAVASTDISSGTNGTTSNNGVITFPVPSADWGVVRGFGIFDSYTNGNLLFWGNLTIPKTVNNGDSAPTFPINSLTIQLDN